MSYTPFPAFTDWHVEFDPTVVDAYAARLRRIRESATAEARQRALTIATRMAAVDTGAIEGLYTTDRGFTRTIATQSEFWEQALDTRGEHVRRSIEDALNAYEYVLDATTRSVAITANWIRELHAIITKHQATYTVNVLVDGVEHSVERPLPHGRYKTDPNHPTNRSTGRVHHYSQPGDETVSEMLRLTDELASAAFAATHPVVQAAYAHYAYVCIHPFADGNGRVARALASVYLYRNPGVPLVVFADQRDQYIDRLEAADSGNPVPFINFLADRVVDTIGLVNQSMVQPDAMSEVLAGLSAALNPDPAPTELTLPAERLLAACATHLQRVVNALTLPGAVTLYVFPSRATSDTGVPAGYFVPTMPNNEVYVAAYVGGAPAIHRHDYLLTVTTDSAQPTFQIISSGGAEPLDVWLREIEPTLTASLELKLSTWAESAISRILSAVQAAVSVE